MNMNSYNEIKIHKQRKQSLNHMQQPNSTNCIAMTNHAYMHTNLTSSATIAHNNNNMGMSSSSNNKLYEYTPMLVSANSITFTKDTEKNRERQRQSIGNIKTRSTSLLPKSYNNNNSGYGPNAPLNTECNVFRNSLLTNPNNNTTGQKITITNLLSKNPTMQAPKGSILLSWGQLPFRSNTSSQITKIAKNILKFSLGQQHIVYVNNKYEAYGLGASGFGQLGYYQALENQVILDNAVPIPILEQLMIQEVFCTPFCTFLITNRDQIYACGLNNRGQLGISPTAYENSSTVSTPIKVCSLSKKSLIAAQPQPTNQHLSSYTNQGVSSTISVTNGGGPGLKRSKSTKLHCYGLVEKNIGNIRNISNNGNNPKSTQTQQSKLITQKSQNSVDHLFCNPNINGNTYTQISTEQKQNQYQYLDHENERENALEEMLQSQSSILDDNQFIVSISGGPFHTIALSNKGRVFYTGSIYKKSSIINDDYTTKFSQLNLKKINKVAKIKSGLSCIGLLNIQGSLFILGALTENIICDEPYNVGINCIVDFGIGKDKIYVVTSLGDVWVLCCQKKNLKSYKVSFSHDIRNAVKIVQIQCGLDYCIFVDEKGQLYGQGNNYANIMGSQLIPIQKSTRQGTSASINSAHESQKKASTVQYYQEPVYKINYRNMKVYGLKTGINFAMGLCDKYVQNQRKQNNIQKQKQKQKQKEKQRQKQRQKKQQKQNNQILLKRIQQLQKQNKMFKDLLKDQNSQKTTSNTSQLQNQNAGTGNLSSTINLNNGSARKKDSYLGTSQGITLTKKQSNNQSSSNNGNSNVSNNNGYKFDMNQNISEKVINKARKFDSSMEIPFEQLQLGKQISEGGYGIIYKAVWRKTTVAVKIFKIDLNSENSIKDFVSQCHAMQALRHPNIVMFLGACTKPPNFAIVLQFCQGGTLWSILQKNGEVNWQQRRKFALDTARGMNYLHERPTPILHRDLKSLNLLLDQNKRVKLADFGWTKGLQNYMTGKIGTYQWMAPQVVSSHQYTQKADVFSFGIILWQIASRQAPYRNIPGVQVAQDVLHKDLRPTIPKKTPEPFAALMKKCWGKIPESRPSFAQIIEELQVMQLPN